MVSYWPHGVDNMCINSEKNSGNMDISYYYKHKKKKFDPFTQFGHFPIQKDEKISPSNSSEVMLPVISDKLLCACLKSSATNSPEPD